MARPKPTLDIYPPWPEIGYLGDDSHPPVVCVMGPTASGKTSLSLELARAFNGEIVICDSRQLYQGFVIGTASVTPLEQTTIPHHLANSLDPTHPITVAEYQTTVW
jgi:tRNA dimethylallyltransferase